MNETFIVVASTLIAAMHPRAYSSDRIGILLLIFSLIFPLSTAVWLNESYWTSINRDGRVEVGRSVSDFLVFPPSQGFVAYWKPSPEEESFGHSYIAINGNRTVSEKVCARFVNPSRKRNVEQICGGFRVLSMPRERSMERWIFKPQPKTNPFHFAKSAIANPDRSVDYLDRQISRVYDESSKEWRFGCANLRDKISIASRSRGPGILRVSFSENRAKYVEQVEYLERRMDPIILEATPGKPPTTSSPPPPKATKPEEIVLLEEMLYIPLPAEEQSSKRSMIEPSADWEVRATASAITRNDVVPKAEIELLPKTPSEPSPMTLPIDNEEEEDELMMTGGGGGIIWGRRKREAHRRRKYHRRNSP